LHHLIPWQEIKECSLNDVPYSLLISRFHGKGMLTRYCVALLFVPIIHEMLHALGHKTLGIIFGFGDFALFTARSFAAVVKPKRLGRRVIRAVYEQGTVCLPVILIVGMFTGLVLGLQGYHILQRFGSESLLGALVSLSLIREMAPVLASLMLVGQAGSALAAELGIQRNTEQIVALETMGVNSLGYLVSPRLLAALVVFPIQTALFVVIGLWGGALSGSLLLVSIPASTGPRWSKRWRPEILGNASSRLPPSACWQSPSVPIKGSMPTVAVRRPVPARSVQRQPGQWFFPASSSWWRTM